MLDFAEQTGSGIVILVCSFSLMRCEILVQVVSGKHDSPTAVIINIFNPIPAYRLCSSLSKINIWFEIKTIIKINNVYGINSMERNDFSLGNLKQNDDALMLKACSSIFPQLQNPQHLPKSLTLILTIMQSCCKPFCPNKNQQKKGVCGTWRKHISPLFFHGVSPPPFSKSFSNKQKKKKTQDSNVVPHRSTNQA